MRQVKNPMDMDRVIEDAAKRIIVFSGGRNATYPVPIVVVGGKGPGGLVATLAAKLNIEMRLMWDIRNVHTPSELVSQLRTNSHPKPMIVWCGEELPAQVQREIEACYKHRKILPQLLILVVGVHPEELVRLGRWSPAFCSLFAKRVIDFETPIANERKRNLDRFTARLERCANVVRALIEVDPEVVAYFKEILEQRASTNTDHVIKIADRTWRRAYSPTGAGPTRITRAHLTAAIPHGFDQAVMARPGEALN